MSQDLSPDTDRHHRHDTPPWILGGILIIIGVFLLLGNVTGLNTGNWWALFILIPALGSFANAWRLYRAQDSLTAAVAGPTIGGIILLFVFAMLFFGFNWTLFWPVLLILGGIGALVGAFARK